jgi:DNA-binding NarL/FixJ family response regulator
MSKILITDDHPMIRDGMRKLLENNLPKISIDEASNGAECLKLLMKNKYDLLILDVDMPGRSGLEVLAYIKDTGVSVKTLVFSMHPEEQLAVRVFKLGGYGYISKLSNEENILTAVNAIISGRKHITPEIAERMVDILENPETTSPIEALSSRELQTVRLLAAGKSISEISDELSLSVNTISTYRSRILEKLGLKTTAEIIKFGLENKI